MNQGMSICQLQRGSGLPWRHRKEVDLFMTTINIADSRYAEPNHRWRSQENLSWGSSAPPDPPNWSAAVAASEGRGTHSHRFGQPLSRPPKASVWGHVQDQPRSTCLVRMIWVKDQYAQHWPWTLSRWKQGGLAPRASICLGSMANAEHAGP